MALILQKYKNKRKLGKGAYGDVLLVQDPDGKQLAIKMISKKIIQKQPFLQEYINDQKEVMMSVKNRYVMELYDFAQDENYKYFICEYCQGGDLLNYQAKQPNKVFTLKQATQILSQVIQGLQKLHHQGYLHRDIKPQNILLKKQSKDDKYIFKLADFGFAKKSQNVGGTVLGTENYMSPQIFSNQIYSYEVDMWAFAVLLYFMLNMQFPFRINPHAQIQQKQQELIKNAKTFSYAQAVKKSKKKILQNCTDQVQDLFSKMFNIDGQKRITFVQIRQHPLFKQYFPVIENQSRILYKNKNKPDKFNNFVQTRMSVIQAKPKPKQTAQKQPVKQQALQQNVKQKDAIPQLHFQKQKTVEQKANLDAELDRINFLYQISRESQGKLEFIDPAQIRVLRYNLLKYFVILMRQFIADLKPQHLDKKYPELKWKQFVKTSQFNSIKTIAKKKLDQAQLLLSQAYDQCIGLIGKLKATNPQLQNNLQNEVKTNQFSGPFKKSYRDSTSYIYQQVRTKFSQGNYYPFLTALILMCHAFNQLIACDNQALRKLFPDFINEKKLQEKPIEFSQLRSWMSKASKQQVKNIILGILSAFFS